MPANAQRAAQVIADKRILTDVRIGNIDIDGTTLRVAIRPGTGLGPPLLLCNGIGANLELLKPFVDALDQRLEVISFDVPGVGGSPTPKLPYRFSGLCRLIVGLLDHFNYREADVLGVSWGGALAQAFAKEYPKRCRRLILAATAPGSVMVPGRPSVMFNMMSPRRYLQRNHMNKIAPKIYGGDLRKNPELAAEHVERIMSGGGMGYVWQMMAMMGWTSIHWLHKLKQPTLIMAGKDDPIVPLMNARIMASRIPNSQLHVFDCGHLFIITRAQDMADRVYGFLTEA
jgi:poly(3-hydroxyalkanoate) depolymerase